MDARYTAYAEMPAEGLAVQFSVMLCEAVPVPVRHAPPSDALMTRWTTTTSHTPEFARYIWPRLLI